MGVEYGQGFGVVTTRGSEHSDTFVPGEGAEGRGERSEERGARSGERGAGNEPASAGGLSAPRPLDPSAPSQSITTATNRHGGMLGGISTGLPLVVRCAIKPTSSIPQEKPTVTAAGEPTTIATKGRHDPCLLPRWVPMAEAMLALVLADHMLRQRAIEADFT